MLVLALHVLGVILFIAYVAFRVVLRRRRRRLVAAALSIINDYRDRIRILGEMDPRERRRMMLPGHAQEYYVSLMNELIDATKDVN